MKTQLVTILGLALITAVGVRAEGYSYKEAFEKSGAFNATGSLTLENVNGTVDIRAWDKNEIQISGEKSGKTAEDLKAIEMTIEETADQAVVKVKLPKRDDGRETRANVRFTIMIPATATLERVATVNGAVKIAGVRGSVRAESVNGHVEATDIGGQARLSTVNGGVDAQIAVLPTGSMVSARSTNGGVTLALPADAAVTFDASTVNGGVNCDFPVEVTRRMIGRSLHGTVGGGGSTVKVNTVNGGVNIRKA